MTVHSRRSWSIGGGGSSSASVAPKEHQAKSRAQRRPLPSRLSGRKGPLLIVARSFHRGRFNSISVLDKVVETCSGGLVTRLCFRFNNKEAAGQPIVPMRAGWRLKCGDSREP